MRYIITLAIALCIALTAYADPQQEAAATDKEKKPKVESICPITKISDNNRCMDCHVVVSESGKPKWTVKECDPHKQFNYPCSNFRFMEENGQRVAHLLLETISSDSIARTFVYLNQHPEVKKLVLELHNPGGSMMDMWRIIGLMDNWKLKGNIIETRCQGFAASAAFVIFVNGSDKHRFVNPQALLMWHEVMSFKFLSIESPSSSEDEAKTLRKFQDNANAWLSKKSKLTKSELDEKVKKRDWWMDGKEAVEAGFADGYIK